MLTTSSQEMPKSLGFILQTCTYSISLKSGTVYMTSDCRTRELRGGKGMISLDIQAGRCPRQQKGLQLSSEIPYYDRVLQPGLLLLLLDNKGKMNLTASRNTTKDICIH